jgi:hypothetical protein
VNGLVLVPVIVRCQHRGCRKEQRLRAQFSAAEYRAAPRWMVDQLHAEAAADACERLRRHGWTTDLGPLKPIMLCPAHRVSAAD